MIIDIDYKQVKVPQDIIEFCDYFTADAEREDIKYLEIEFFDNFNVPSCYSSKSY